MECRALFEDSTEWRDSLGQPAPSLSNQHHSDSNTAAFWPTVGHCSKLGFWEISKLRERLQKNLPKNLGSLLFHTNHGQWKRSQLFGRFRKLNNDFPVGCEDIPNHTEQVVMILSKGM